MDIATTVLNWSSAKEAALYFTGQGRGPSLVNKFELRSLELLREKKGYSKDQLISEIASLMESEA